jgi:phospholipid/cholesterol/gamma-HCH transport system substrate-binding protein
MKKQTINSVRLGAFVLIGTLCLVIGLYYIGSNKNIFSPSISVSVKFKDVGGLVPGNNVRFNGINVGTVTDIYAISDTFIKVEFTINKESMRFISKDAIVSIGTDGLLGNKLVNISPGLKNTGPIENGCEMQAQDPIDTDYAMRTLLTTNDNLKIITDRLKEVSEKFADGNSLLHLLTDTTLSGNIRKAVIRFQLTGNNTAMITGDLRDIVKDMKNGKGTIGALLTDSSFSHKLNQTIVNIESISDSMAYITGNFKSFSDKIDSGNGVLGALLTDTMFVHDLNESLQNLKKGSGNFNENMEALKYSWPFKRYFKKHKVKK